ncbi:Protein F46C8.3 [Aphelenchoides avenae]|nr:Protein F46C8.3 [Aphelenchus avenae]
MGSSNSHHPQPLQMQEQPPPYPDMNVIFKGIPKMMQVADDMHVMTSAIVDLRNITVGLSAMSVFGIIMFLILRYLNHKRGSRRRRRLQTMESDSGQSSLGRPYRQFTQKSNDWSHKVDMDRLIEHQGNQTPPPNQTKTRAIAAHAYNQERTPPPNGSIPVKVSTE